MDNVVRNILKFETAIQVREKRSLCMLYTVITTTKILAYPFDTGLMYSEL